MNLANADAKTGTALALDAAGGFDSYQRFNVGTLSKPGGSGPLESKGLRANVEKTLAAAACPIRSICPVCPSACRACRKNSQP